MFFYKELCFVHNSEQINSILRLLKEHHIPFKIKYEGLSINANIARGAGVGRYGERMIPENNMIKIYVKKSAFPTAKALINSKQDQ